MARLLAIAWLALGLGCGGGAEAELHAALQGTWQSDKEATLAEADVIGGFPARVRANLERTLGRRILVISEGRIREQQAGGIASAPYRVLEARERAHGRELVIEGWDHELAEKTQQVIALDGDRLWFWRDGGRWREIYQRVPAVSAP